MIELKEVKLYNTSIIQKACQDSMLNSKMIGIVDYSGAGKTYALDKFVKDNRGVYKIELGPSVTPKEMYIQILNELREEDVNRNESTSSIIRQIRIELKEFTGNRLIIIDEAGRYEKQRVVYFHELRNLTQNKCGLIISAHKDFERHLAKWVSDGISGVEEFSNRFSYFIKLKRPTDSEIKLFFETNGILKTQKQISLFNEILNMKMRKRNWRIIYHMIAGL